MNFALVNLLWKLSQDEELSISEFSRLLVLLRHQQSLGADVTPFYAPIERYVARCLPNIDPEVHDLIVEALDSVKEGVSPLEKLYQESRLGKDFGLR